MKDEADTRIEQFATCSKKLSALISEDEPNTLAIFGGDLNIRDHEVAGIIS